MRKSTFSVRTAWFDWILLDTKRILRDKLVQVELEGPGQLAKHRMLVWLYLDFVKKQNLVENPFRIKRAKVIVPLWQDIGHVQWTIFRRKPKLLRSSWSNGSLYR